MDISNIALLIGIFFPIGKPLTHIIHVFLDDILICAHSVEKQLAIMKQVLGKLAEANVKLNAEKCLVDVTKLVTKPLPMCFCFSINDSTL